MELDKLSLKNSYLQPEIKGLMIQALVRSRLLYGMETCHISEDAVDTLEKFENNIMKDYVNLPR